MLTICSKGELSAVMKSSKSIGLYNSLPEAIKKLPEEPLTLNLTSLGEPQGEG